MSEQCKLTMPTSRDARGRGAWCLEHRDYAQNLKECRASVLTRRAEKAEAQVQRAREAASPDNPQRPDVRFFVRQRSGWDQAMDEVLTALDGADDE